MAIAFRAASYAERSSSSNPTIAYVTVDKPTGVEDGDILLALVNCYYYPGVSIDTPSGWTLLCAHEDDPSPGTGEWQYVFWKRASSEPSTYTFETESDTNIYSIEAVICAYSGCVASGSPIDAYSNTPYQWGTSGTTIRAASVTTTVANAMLVFLGRANNYSITSPSGFTQRVNEPLASRYLHAADCPQADSGASGDKDGSLFNGSPYKHAFLVALAPASNVHELSLATTSSVAIGLQRTTDRTLSTASTVTIGLSRAASVLLSATSSVAPSLVRVTSRGLSVVSAVSASLTRKTAKALSTASTIVIDLATSVTAYVLTARDWLVHTAGWSDPRLLEAVEFWGWLPRTVSRSLVFTATSAPTPTIQRMTSKTLSTASTVVAAVPKKVSRILSAGASSVSITFSKKPVKLLMATSGVTLDLSRAVKKSLSATSATVVSLSRMSRKSLSIIASAVPSLVTRLVYAWRDRRTPCVECAYVVAPTAEAHIYAPIAEVIR